MKHNHLCAHQSWTMSVEAPYRSMVIIGLLSMLVWACGDGGGKQTEPGDTLNDTSEPSTESASTGDTDSGTSPADTNWDSATSDTASAPEGTSLRLMGLPNFKVNLPSSLSKQVSSKKAMVPAELAEVQSEGFYQLQEERIFTEEIYRMRGLLTFLETYSQNNDLVENQVVTLGVQTGIVYEGGPMDGQPVNPHIADIEGAHEGVDLGQLLWWREGESTLVSWWITDTAYGDFPYWQIEIRPGEADDSRRLFRIAAFRPQWDGVQTTVAVRFLEYDESTSETRVFQRDVGYNMDLGGGISYRYVHLKHSSLSDPAMTDLPLDTDSALEGDMAVPADAADETLVYLESGDISPADLSVTVKSRIAAVGNENGGGIAASTIPFSMWNDDGAEVAARFYFRELYNGAGNLITRSYARKFDGICELNEFSGFLPDTEAVNVFLSSLLSAPSAVYVRNVSDFAAGTSSASFSLDDPAMENWTDIPQDIFPGRVIWKQDTTTGATWQTGDVRYDAAPAELTDCSVVGETSCTISVFYPTAVFPLPVELFGEAFFVETQWPVRYLSAADSGSLIKVETMETYPYLQTWLEADDNDVLNEGDVLLRANVFDVYFYTPDGELVESAMPMVYSASTELPSSLVFDAAAQATAETANADLDNVLAEFVPASLLPTDIVLPSDEEFKAQFEASTDDTASQPQDTDTSTPINASDPDTDSL